MIKGVKIGFIFSPLLSLIPSILSPNPGIAQYAYTAPYLPGENIGSIKESSFSITTGEMSCSSGGGTPPSLFLGGMLGNGNAKNRTYNDPYFEGVPSSISIGQNDDFVTGLVGLTIPLGSRSNKDTDCEELLTIVELGGFLKMMESMRALNILDEVNAKAMIYTYLESTGKKLGLDLRAALVDPENISDNYSLKNYIMNKRKQ